VSYPRSEGYHIGTYNIQVVIEKYYGFWYVDLQSGRTEIEVTDVLSGNMSISQNGTVREEFVSVRQPVNQTIVLKENDLALLQQATYVRTYWFVDCVYKGMTDNYSLAFDFTELDHTYNMEALVVASYDVLPEPTTTTQVRQLCSYSRNSWVISCALMFSQHLDGGNLRVGCQNWYLLSNFAKIKSTAKHFFSL
jgi:hypothetical protein